MFNIRLYSCLILVSFFAACGTSNNTKNEGAETIDLQQTDYTFFEDSLNIEFAKNFEISKHSNFKKLVLHSRLNNKHEVSEYYLVKRGTPYPKGVHSSKVIEVPVRKVVALSNTHVGMLDRLRGLSALKGVDAHDYIPDRTIRTKIESGEIKEVGAYSKLNEELILAMKPDVVLYDDMGQDETYPALKSQGICLLPISSWQEETPLGRTEWLKVMALLLDKPERATLAFDRTRENYFSWKSFADTLDRSVNVICGLPYKGVWHMAGGKSFTAQFIEAAGGNFMFKENDVVAAVPVDFEVVFKKAQQSQVWLNVGPVKTKEELVDLDERYALFPPYSLNRIYNNNGLEIDGVNAFWYTGYLNPDLVLKDLIKIIHPEAFSDSTLVYYRPIN
ncbi:ABC transporter substrate-binding protein [Persicobacter diffluens]|uniref:Iron ABC transporter substrate-binding protein n=1 Tax=Persicobacter diffluens TaxID=981 RepID=A0AAN4VXE8_9BACT|nr:iron ABC transporter substrate-binding protein [Persicobacter diffluens]